MMRSQLARQTVGAGARPASPISYAQLRQNALMNGTTGLLSAQTARAYYSEMAVNRIKDAPTSVLPPFPHFPIPRVTPSQDAPQKLVEWVTTHKGYVNPLLHVGCVQQYLRPGASDDGNWGLVVKEDIPEDTILATVPVPLCLFPLEHPAVIEGAPAPIDQADVFYQGVAGVISAVNLNFWQLRLGVRLLAERAADTSFYSPYINALPATFPSHPFFYSRDAANALQYLPIQKDLGLRSRTIHTLAKHLQITDPNVPFNQMPALARLSIGAFNGFQPSAADLAWATAAVGSRAFQSPLTPPTPGAPKADAKCMIPLVDMSNHSFEPNCKTSFMATTDGVALTSYKNFHVVLRSVRAIKRGEEVSLNYFRPSAVGENDSEDLATMVSQLTLDMSLGASNKPKNIRSGFIANLTSAPDYSTNGASSDATNDEILLSYGFTPSFNAGDSVSLSDNAALFATALEMAHDITIAVDNEFDEDPLNAPTPDLSDDEGESEMKKGEIEGSLDANGLPPLDDMFTEADRIVNEAKINRAKLMKPTINVVLPEVKDQSQTQKDIIEDLPMIGIPLALTFRGPNDALLSLLRAMVLGARTPGEGTVEEIRDRDLAKAEQRARTKLASMGDEKAFERQLHPSEWVLGFGVEEPLSEANEKAAMALLYHMLVMASASFPNKLHNDAQLMSTAIRKRAEDEYTACKFSRSKKQLISHSMKVLASQLNLDDNLHKWHFMLD